ncbi:MAG: aminotransferase class III-fold pyridoxal phosphate-dependent enzyme [Rhodospirillaceae bacterium]|jgi:L-2,4-diaminobutyrate transaminase|nr:aminotransferase class III-fold pyridoxal phosphate-dependent enzyme [Rhodospirillaceae bacterium]
MTMDAASNINLEQMDVDATIHAFTSLPEHAETGPHIMTSADGIYLTDSKGDTYIDSMAALFCVNAGYGRSEIADAISEQAHKFAYFHTFAGNAHEQQIKLGDRLLNILPRHMSKVLFASSGSEANDANVKLAWMYQHIRGKPNKRKIIARDMGYHGVTTVAASMSGLPLMHQPFGLPLPGFLHTDKGHYYWEGRPGESERDFSKRMAANLDALIEAEGPDTVCAFISEPVMGAAACVAPAEGYFEEIQKVLKKHDVLFIADEVITGFGRLGTWFACEKYDLKPDMMTLSKGITSAYVPLSASVISDKMWQVFADDPENMLFTHGHTASGHPIACAAANANLDLMEGEGLIENAARVGAYFKEQLIDRLADHPLMGEIRGDGLLLATELVANKQTKQELDIEWDCSHRLFDLCLEEKLISRGFFGHNSSSFSPPLCVTNDEIDEIITRFSRGLDKLTDELVRDGRWKPTG